MFKRKPIVTAIALSISNFTHADTTTGLAARWNFDTCTAQDSSGHANHGTLVGGVTCVSGIRGKI